MGKKMRPKGKKSFLQLDFMRGLVWAGPVYFCTLCDILVLRDLAG